MWWRAASTSKTTPSCFPRIMFLKVWGCTGKVESQLFWSLWWMKNNCSPTNIKLLQSCRVSHTADGWLKGENSLSSGWSKYSRKGKKKYLKNTILYGWCVCLTIRPSECIPATKKTHIIFISSSSSGVFEPISKGDRMINWLLLLLNPFHTK